MKLTPSEIEYLADALSRLPMMQDYGRRLDLIAHLPPLFQDKLGAHDADSKTHFTKIVTVAVAYPADGKGSLLQALHTLARATAADPDQWQPSPKLTDIDTRWTEMAARVAQPETAAPLVNIGAEEQGQIDISGNVAAGDIHIHEKAYKRYQPIDPDAAEATLANMPLDELPTHGRWPQWSLVPYGRNKAFVGRKDVLLQAAQLLKPGAAERPVAIVSGMGGIGKTQVAVEFVSRYGQFFAGGVFWLNFADADNIEAEIVRCGGQEGMALPTFESLNFKNQLGRVTSEWEAALPRLLICDNCEDPKLIEKWRPKTGGCRLLVTTRRGDWSSLTTVDHKLLPLQLMTEAAEYRTLLRQLAAHLTDDEMDQIATMLDYHPLALHVAGSYLAANAKDYPVADFLAAIGEEALQEESLVQSSEALQLPGGHTPHIYATFALSTLQLDPEVLQDRLAQMALTHAAFFAPAAPLPHWLLAQTLLQRTDAGLPTSDNKKDVRKAKQSVRQAVQRLVQLGLIDRAEDNLRLHRLIAAFVLERTSRMQKSQPADVDQLQLAQESVEKAVLHAANTQNNASDWLTLRPWQTQLLHITAHAQNREDEAAADLCNTTAYFLNNCNADYAAARPYYERALAIYEKVLGAEHPDTALSLNNLGFLLQTEGDYAAARPYYERAVAIYRRALGDVHPTSITIISNYLDNLVAADEIHVAVNFLQVELGATHPLTVQLLGGTEGENSNDTDS
ncbi:MAG: tetratricopeptide repeat protein [Aestuariibacter sp.]|nr:tetratricopeptide repeat protein [Aestuariibacter sp.]